MESYKQFAKIYDELMKEVPYLDWVSYIEDIFKRYNIPSKTILELGCGTGNVTLLLKKKGYEITGMDLSQEMLFIAKEKAKKENIEISFVQGNMIDFQGEKKVDVVLSLCDSINYILEEEDLLEVFHNVNENLKEGGYFIFDINTIYKFSRILSENTFIENTEEITYIWENFFDEENSINEYNITFFVKNEEETYNKFEEFHEERGYSIEIIKKLLEYADLECIDIFDAFTFESPKKESERIYFIAQKK